MSSTIPKAPSLQTVTPDEGLLLLEALAVLGVLVWVGAMAWMAVGDVMRFRAHHSHHHAHPFRRAAHRFRHGHHE
ncbi:hypothetical protein [Aeromicrobium sp. 179-A 4D2 NHS]|uniref:hypothetical protein n=1 Tax=Aeromicrobium sp. 179-A 4D2 NHS TaxID=3142375 RepID=UPI0039A12528